MSAYIFLPSEFVSGFIKQYFDQTFSFAIGNMGCFIKFYALSELPTPEVIAQRAA